MNYIPDWSERVDIKPNIVEATDREDPYLCIWCGVIIVGAEGEACSYCMGLGC